MLSVVQFDILRTNSITVFSAMFLLATLVFEGKSPYSLLQNHHVPYQDSTFRMDHTHSLQALDGFEEKRCNFFWEPGPQYASARSGIRVIFDIGFEVREAFRNAGSKLTSCPKPKPFVNQGS